MSEQLWRLVGTALLPAVGMLAGALAAELWRLSRHTVGALLHAAAGVAVAVVSIELMPHILADIAPWQLVTGFALGAAASVLLAGLVNRAVRFLELGRSGPWRVYLAVAIDLLGDGLMIGIGTAVSGGLGLMLGLSQVVANIPGGFVTLANLRHKEVPRSVRLTAAASLVVPVLLGASVGYFLLREQSGAIQNTALAFVAGMLLLATVEDLVPEADEPKTRRFITTGAFAVGFAFFALLALHIG